MEEPAGTASAPAGGGHWWSRARPWMALPIVAVLLLAAFAGMQAGRDDDPARAHGPTGSDELVASPSTTLLGADPAATGAADVTSVNGGARPSARRVTTGSRSAGSEAAPTGGGSTATTAPGGTTAEPAPGSTVPPSETNPPNVYGLRAGDELPDGPDQIFDGSCGPTSISVSALASDGSGIRSATLYWSFTGASGPVSGARAMSVSGSQLTASFGPFPPGTAPAGGVQIAWYVEATDGAGNTTRAIAPTAPADERITLSPCA